MREERRPAQSRDEPSSDCSIGPVGREGPVTPYAVRMRATGHLGDVLSSGRRSFSFELFPPKTDEGERTLWRTVRDIEALKPTFVSVTYGAGGSTQDRTVRLTGEIASDTTLVPVGHLTCVGASQDELRDVIGQYAGVGVTSLLALRGDPPTGLNTPWEPHPGGLDHAVELVELIRSLGEFSIGVAAFPEGHPESPDLAQDARVLALKQQAGAEFAITQLFFRVSDYERLVESASAAGCTMPIIPGIIPVTNVAQIERFAALAGAEFPAEHPVFKVLAVGKKTMWLQLVNGSLTSGAQTIVVHFGKPLKLVNQTAKLSYLLKFLKATVAPPPPPPAKQQDDTATTSATTSTSTSTDQTATVSSASP